MFSRVGSSRNSTTPVARGRVIAARAGRPRRCCRKTRSGFCGQRAGAQAHGGPTTIPRTPSDPTNSETRSSPVTPLIDRWPTEMRLPSASTTSRARTDSRVTPYFAHRSPPAFVASCRRSTRSGTCRVRGVEQAVRLEVDVELCVDDAGLHHGDSSSGDTSTMRFSLSVDITSWSGSPGAAGQAASGAAGDHREAESGGEADEVLHLLRRSGQGDRRPERSARPPRCESRRRVVEVRDRGGGRRPNLDVGVLGREVAHERVDRGRRQDAHRATSNGAATDGSEADMRVGLSGGVEDGVRPISTGWIEHERRIRTLRPRTHLSRAVALRHTRSHATDEAERLPTLQKCLPHAHTLRPH